MPLFVYDSQTAYQTLFNLKTVLSQLAVDRKGRRNNESATAFCLDGTNLMHCLMAARIIAHCCRRIAASEGITVMGPTIRSIGL